eukprot:TRINITY_DN8440_c0_g1_i18.p1 TRINITY_DN8440_c0_g1~~TRINITY_DN8440_c0_g1_i18.p1  ORF type:complete len:473 (-),score=86.32 TRINITY_DN8440_c0_g1_i18:2687-4105(-)
MFACWNLSRGPLLGLLCSTSCSMFNQTTSGEHCNNERVTQTDQNREATRLRQHKYWHKNKEAINCRRREAYSFKNKETINQRRREAYRLKESRRQYQQNYWIKNRDVVKAQRQEYRKINREAIKVQQKDYQLKYWLKNKEAIKVRRREYRHNNKEAIRAQQKEYRAKKKKPDGDQKDKKRSWATLVQVREFFESVKEKLHISSTSDWYRISQKQLKRFGGSGVYKKFKKIGVALQHAYPEIEWDMSKFSCPRKRSGQRWLKVVLSRLLPPNTELHENFLHHQLFWDTTTNIQNMELDIWVPEYNLALEYQGEQHYFDVHEAYGPNGTTAMYKERDLKKKQACFENGITLVAVPYWWDGQQESLASTLHLLRPDIFAFVDSPPIPCEPPTMSSTTKFLSSLGNHSVAALMMNGREWHKEDQDPTDWIISEKLDGMRAYWDGSRLYSKQGLIFPVPKGFTQYLPQNVALDGELW